MFQRVIKFFPEKIRQQIAYGNNKNIITNIAWLIGDKIFRLGGGLYVGVLIARYLGPQQYGLFNFAFAFVWLFSFVATLGLDEILVRELIVQPEKKEIIMGTGFSLKALGSCLAFLIIVGTFLLLPKQNASHVGIFTVMSFSMIIRSVDVIRLWFESQLQSRLIVIAENTAFIICAVSKVLFVLFRLPFIYFVWVTTLEMAIAGIILMYFYKKHHYLFKHWRVRKNEAIQLLKDSWPLIIAGLSISIYVKSDQVLLGILASENEAGIYSAAARISEIWYFIPTTIVVSMFPGIINAKATSKLLYNLQLQRLFDLVLAISLSIAFIMTFLAKWMVVFLFGNDYSGSGSVLAIHIWSGIFVFLGVASSKVFIAENLMKDQFYRTFIGALLNIILNVILIPIMGAIGSAIATVISYAISVFSAYFFPNTKGVACMMFSSLNIVRLFRQYVIK